MGLMLTFIWAAFMVSSFGSYKEAALIFTGLYMISMVLNYWFGKFWSSIHE